MRTGTISKLSLPSASVTANVHEVQWSEWCREWYPLCRQALWGQWHRPHYQSHLSLTVFWRYGKNLDAVSSSLRWEILLRRSWVRQPPNSRLRATSEQSRRLWHFGGLSWRGSGYYWCLKIPELQIVGMRPGPAHSQGQSRLHPPQEENHIRCARSGEGRPWGCFCFLGLQHFPGGLLLPIRGGRVIGSPGTPCSQTS